MKHLITFLFIVLSLVLLPISAQAQESIPVANKVYEGSLQGMAILTFDFKDNGNAIFTMSLFGNKESKDVTYEQNGNQIIVHAQNGDMILTQNENNILNTNIKGNLIRLTCQTPDNNIEKLSEVANHTFSGTFGNNGKLTLLFCEGGAVKVSVFSNNQLQEENWPYIQEGDSIVLTEPMGRKITLKLNGNNELKGMFTIINVTLSLID